MKCRKISQFVMLITGISMICYGAFRGEGDVVLGNADSAQCLLITQAFASQHNTSDCDYQQKNGGSDKQCRRSCPPF